MSALLLGVTACSLRVTARRVAPVRVRSVPELGDDAVVVGRQDPADRLGAHEARATTWPGAARTRGTRRTRSRCAGRVRGRARRTRWPSARTCSPGRRRRRPPRVDEHQLGHGHRGEAGEHPDLVGVGLGVEVTADDRRERPPVRSGRGDELAQRADLQQAHVALVQAPVEVGARTPRSGRAGRRRRRGATTRSSSSPVGRGQRPHLAGP